MRSSPPPGSRLSGYLLIIAAAILWGLSATGAKYLFNHDVDVFLVVQTRATFSVLLLWIVFLARRPELLKVRPARLYPFALLGVFGIAGSTFTYYRAMKLTNVATAILIQYTAPVFVMLWELFRRKIRLTAANGSALLLAMAGCYLAVGGWQALAGRMNLEGLLWANVAALAFAFFNVYGKNLLERHSSWTGLTWALTFTTLLWFFIRPPWVLFTAPISAGEWGTLFLFAMTSILIPYSLYFKGLERIASSHAIIIATLEPVVAILSASIVVGEVLSGMQYAGAAGVIAAILLLARHHEQRVIPVD